MQVVDREHTVDLRHLRPDRLDREPVRHAFHQRVQALAQQAPARERDQHADGKRRDRVDARPAAERDHAARSERGDRAERIADDVQPGGARVHVMAVQAAHDPEVEGEAHGSDGSGCTAAHGSRFAEANHGFVGERDHDREHRAGIDECCDDFRASETVGMALRWRPLRHPRRQSTEAERRAVGQHVARIREERERPGPPAAERFDEREDDRDDRRRAKAVTRRGVLVIVIAVMLSHARF